MISDYCYNAWHVRKHLWSCRNAQANLPADVTHFAGIKKDRGVNTGASNYYWVLHTREITAEEALALPLEARYRVATYGKGPERRVFYAEEAKRYCGPGGG